MKLSVFRRFFFPLLFFFAPCIFAAVPIQDKSLSGAAAAQARLKLVSKAESFLGVPYRYAGIDRKGLDCSGFVYVSFKEALDFSIPRSADAIYSWVEKINTADLQIGDLVFFVTAGSSVSHVGIYIGEARFIHSASEGPHTGVIYSRLDETYWKRTYKGAGRALPWDEAAAAAMASAGNRAGSGEKAEGAVLSDYSGSSAPQRVWKDSGLYVGFGAAWTWGGFFEGSSSLFRGFSGLATAGYKGAKYRAGLELRPELDLALGVFRLPLTFSIGTDIFQVFGGPAVTFEEPCLSLGDGERYYTGGNGGLRWELGVSGAFPPIAIGRGVLSIYGELAWQPYFLGSGENFNFWPDITANLRLSTGLRYLWHL